MRLKFIAKHRGIWPVAWICEALGVSRSGFHAWLVRAPSRAGPFPAARGGLYQTLGERTTNGTAPVVSAATLAASSTATVPHTHTMPYPQPSY